MTEGEKARTDVQILKLDGRANRAVMGRYPLIRAYPTLVYIPPRHIDFTNKFQYSRTPAELYRFMEENCRP